MALHDRKDVEEAIYRFLCANITYINKKKEEREKLIGDAHYGTLNDLKI